MSNVLWPIPLAALILLFLLFPTGHLHLLVGVPSSGSMVILLVLSVGALILATAGWSQPFAGIDVAAGRSAPLPRPSS